MSAQTYEIPDYVNSDKKDDHIYAVPEKENKNATGPTDGVKKLRRLVFVLIILVVVFGIVAVAVPLGISRGGDNSSAPPAQNGQTSGACSSGPCTNQGTCTNVPPDDYVCSCTAGYYGRNCGGTRLSSDACSSGPCLNQGTCTNVYPDDYVCSCVATYYGRNCEHSSPGDTSPSSDACLSRPCSNQATCVGVPPDNYVCSCMAGYYGRNCEHSFPDGSGPSSDACSSGPCVNQGTCTNIPPDDYVCSCKTSYYGRNCENKRELNIVTGCEDNEVTVVPPVQLSCPPDGGAIHVIYGNYGRTEPYSKVCPYAPHVATHEDTACVAAGAESMITALCDGRSSCQFTASNSQFGDPCVGTYKYAEVHFMCV